MRRKKVAIIGTNGIPAKYGGFETLAEYLAIYLNTEYDITVYCSGVSKDQNLKRYHNTNLVYLPLKANGWQSILYDACSIIHALFTSDVLVILGFSGAIAFPCRIFFKKKVVFNIGGIEWKKVRGKKFLSSLEIAVKKSFEKLCIWFSDVVVVDNQVLQVYIKGTYNVDSVLAEYGGDHATRRPITDDLKVEFPFLETKYDVTVSRAQEDMNIHLLLEAYKQIPERNLVVVSNWNISDYGIKLKSDNYEKYPNIFLQDAVYNLDYLNVIRGNAEIYFHTHSLCGTAPSLVEAMNIGLPIICFDVETNRSTTEQKSFYFGDVASLISIIKRLKKSDLEKLGNDMLKIAEKRYYWKRIASLYKTCIE